MVKSIKKRDNSLVEFKLEKIINAIHKAGLETSEFDVEEANILAERVLIELHKSNTYNESLSVEDVQDVVELVLLNSEYKNTAKAYILYRDKRNQERKLDIFKLVRDLKISNLRS